MEKLANHIALQSITEGGMEKKALNFGQLMRMAKTFANRDKLNHFNKLLAKRHRAMEQVYGSRLQKLDDAATAAHNEYKATRSMAPAAREALRLERRLPHAVDELDWRLPNVYNNIKNPGAVRNMLSNFPQPARIPLTGKPSATPYVDGLEDFTNYLRSNQPGVLDDIIRA